MSQIVVDMPALDVPGDAALPAMTFSQLKDALVAYGRANNALLQALLYLSVPPTIFSLYCIAKIVVKIGQLTCRCVYLQSFMHPCTDVL